jgi:hypothetical protein
MVFRQCRTGIVSSSAVLFPLRGLQFGLQSSWRTADVVSMLTVSHSHQEPSVDSDDEPQ